jgi:23S rRNA pseudouridine2604 synthase
VRILGTVTKPCIVERVGGYMFKIILTQGLNRQIRRMCSFFGYKILRLQRVRIMNLTLAGLKVGQWRDLTPAEVRALVPAAAALPQHPAAASRSANPPHRPVSTLDD